jgi:hypothetical protein
MTILSKIGVGYSLAPPYHGPAKKGADEKPNAPRRFEDAKKIRYPAWPYEGSRHCLAASLAVPRRKQRPTAINDARSCASARNQSKI